MSDGIRIYNLFPTLAGPIARWIGELPRIAAMGFDTVYVNPFHYPGFSGSLYAVKDHYRLNPRFRGDADGDDDTLLRGFTTAAAGEGLRVIMDLVVNHTSKDSELVARRPDWFARGRDGEVLSPSAIDPADATRKTVWGDLAELDYRPEHRHEILAYFQELVRHYAGLGFGGFRCDAAYKVPAEVWRGLVAAARTVDPTTIFCAETLGAPTEAVLALADAGFDYLFNSVKWWDFESSWLLDQYEAFRHIAPSIGFPESHDTPRLVAELLAAGFPESEIEARYRQAYAVAAVYSTGVMMPMGFEYGWSRPLDVVAAHDDRHEKSRFDISGFIAAVNALKKAVPALNEEGPQLLLSSPDDPLVTLLRQSASGRERALILINTQERDARALDRAAVLGLAGLTAAEDRIALQDLSPGRAATDIAADARIALGPLEVRVLRATLRGARPIRRAAASAVGGEPGHHPLWRPEARILIESVAPELDGGRYPVKRVVGDEFEVRADLFRDGHDKLAAIVRYKPPGEGWRETPLTLFDNDRWVARFPLDRVGRWLYTIEAWTDRFASWCEEVTKKQTAGQAIASELAEGRALVEAALPRAAAADVRLLRRALAGPAGDAASMLEPRLRVAMARAADRDDRVAHGRELEIVVDRVEARCAAWYEMFPRSQGRRPDRSATFDDCINRLGDVAALGFDVVYLVPIHPIGEVNRKGRDNSVTAAPGDPGSPYAIGSAEGGHRAVDPGLGTLADFRRFVAAADELGLEIALDFAVQCAPDHPWVREHPGWFHFRPDGTIKYAENPPKKYQDIVNVEFYNRDRDGLWNELRDTVLFWIEAGVRIFRVDNPHTKPVPFWEWLIREVKSRCPEAIFLAEAFTRPKMMRALAKAGFTQSYTYFTWRNTKEELIEYATELAQSESAEYFGPNFFTNTPDILTAFLQNGGRAAFRIRLVLAATLSGVYGIYNGFELCENRAVAGSEEYLHSEKYEFKVWDWDRPGNIKSDIAIINRFRRDNPALQRLEGLRFVECDDPNLIAYVKATSDRTNVVLVVVNLDPQALHAADVVLPLAELGLPQGDEFVAEEAFSGAVQRWRGSRQRMSLDPGSASALVFRLHPVPSPMSPP